MLTAWMDSLFTTLSVRSIPLSLVLAAFPGGSLMLSTSSPLPGTLDDSHLASCSHDQGLGQEVPEGVVKSQEAKRINEHAGG